MSRLHLKIFAVIFFPLVLNGQNELGKYLEFADAQYRKGDYVYALDYYQKALELDSNSVAILWKYAETLRAYKDYPKAAYYYEKVYNKEECAIYPSSLLQWALMTKQQGHYEVAVELLKRAKKKYAKNKKDYLYLKAKRELESTLWAQSAIKDTLELLPVKLPEGLNSPNAEFGHTLRDKQFYFSSLRADSIGTAEEIYDPVYTTKLYTIELDTTLKEVDFKAANLDKKHTGNGSFSRDGNRYYYSVCDAVDDRYTCRIAVLRRIGNKWSEPTFMSEEINVPGTNTSTPTIAFIDGEEWLIWSSDKSGGEGGMDLYFTVLKNEGNQISKIKAISAVNSPDNEITPWWDEKERKLYFASAWWDGFGGTDIHFSTLKDGRFEAPKNGGLPFNSAANDNYYFEFGDSSFVSSNRMGVLYSKNPTCCSDIFAFSIPKVIQPETKKETLADLNKRLPVTLYFHNDIPDPRSRETTTKVNYMDAYSDYTAMIPEYKKEYSKGLSGEKASDAEEDIESFFTEYVDKGVRDLELFKTLLLEELQKGIRVRVSVRGFASPLARTEYNVALTQRRIQSLINHLKVCDNGAFAPYLDGTAANGGKLEVVGLPFGEYTANQITSDNPNDLKNSVFSRAAAIERKIEIQSVSYLDTDSLFFLMDWSPRSLVFGQQAIGSHPSQNLTLSNNSTQALRVLSAYSADSVYQVVTPFEILPGRSTIVEVNCMKGIPAGIYSTPLLLYVEGYEKPVSVMVLSEGK
ncbi:MAG: hypothetical protein ACOVO3_00330 [Fluviicola sp.]